MRFLFGLAALPLMCVSAVANPACDQALIISTYSESSSYSSDWRLAKYIDEGTWNTLSKGASAKGTIQGVPVGGSYAEYKQNIAKKSQGSTESLTVNQARSVMWTGLDPSAASAYTKCLEIESKKQPGLYISVIGVTDTEVVVLAGWSIPGAKDVVVKWSPPEVEGVTLDREIPGGGETFVRFPRPKGKLILGASYQGYTTKPLLVIEPLPAPLPPEIANCVKQNPVGTCIRCEFDVSESASRDASNVVASRTCTKMPVGEKVKFAISNFSSHYEGPKNINCHMTVIVVGPDGKGGNAIVGEATQCDATNRSGGTDFVKPSTDGSASVGLMLPTCDGHALAVGHCELAGHFAIFTAEGQ